MRRVSKVMGALACALPLACADSSNAPTAPRPVPSFSGNGAYVEWGESGFSYDDVGPCGTEPLRFQGILHSRYHLVVTPSGSTRTMQLIIEEVGTATGVNTGTVWQLIRVPQLHTLESSAKTALYLVHESLWYGTEAGDRLHVNMDIHFTWNANGELTASKVDLGDCHLQPR